MNLHGGYFIRGVVCLFAVLSVLGYTRAALLFQLYCVFLFLGSLYLSLMLGLKQLTDEYVMKSGSVSSLETLSERAQEQVRDMPRAILWMTFLILFSAAMGWWTIAVLTMATTGLLFLNRWLAEDPAALTEPEMIRFVLPTTALVEKPSLFSRLWQWLKNSKKQLVIIC